MADEGPTSIPKSGTRPRVTRQVIAMARDCCDAVSDLVTWAAQLTPHLSRTYMDRMLPNINERSAMSRSYLPPIRETYSRAEVDAILAAALAKATGDMDSMIRRLAEAADKKFSRI